VSSLHLKGVKELYQRLWRSLLKPNPSARDQPHHFGCASDFWFTPNSGHVAAQQQLTLSANNRHDAALFDYFVRQT
jgi:hypothetical protein